MFTNTWIANQYWFFLVFISIFFLKIKDISKSINKFAVYKINGMKKNLLFGTKYKIKENTININVETKEIISFAVLKISVLFFIIIN